MKLVIDINLSPKWAEFLQTHGFDAVHWFGIGDPRAPDPVMMAWARERGCVVFTHDLDFSRILALTRATGPSVFLVRTEDVLPSAIGGRVQTQLAGFGDDDPQGFDSFPTDALASRGQSLQIPARRA
jgi:predicted nuclease of predicted toxin-antitoxin system